MVDTSTLPMSCLPAFYFTIHHYVLCLTFTVPLIVLILAYPVSSPSLLAHDYSFSYYVFSHLLSDLLFNIPLLALPFIIFRRH